MSDAGVLVEAIYRTQLKTISPPCSGRLDQERSASPSPALFARARSFLPNRACLSGVPS
jgi:hypothetical protein